MPNETGLADAIVQSSEGEEPEGLPAVEGSEETTPASSDGAAAAEESTDKGEEQESSTEPQAETPEQMQVRIAELQADLKARDETIEERTGAYNGLMSQLQQAQQQVQATDAIEAQQDAAELAARGRQSSDEDDPEWLDIVANRAKMARWLDRGDALRDRAMQRNMRGEMFVMRAQEINDQEAKRVFGVIDTLRQKAGMTNAEWDTFRAEFGERTDEQGKLTQCAFHMFGTDFTRIEKTATDIIQGRYAPKVVAEASANAERNATRRVQKTMLTQLPSGGGAAPEPPGDSDSAFEREIVEFDDTSG